MKVVDVVLRSQVWPLEQLPGLQPKIQQQLARLNITTTQDLLGYRHPPLARQLAQRLQVPLRYVHKWLALADLARVPSVGCQHTGLLLHVGIVSVPQLAQATYGNLYRRIQRLHITTLTRRDLCPTPDQVATWIREAQLLTKQRR